MKKSLTYKKNKIKAEAFDKIFDFTVYKVWQPEDLDLFIEKVIDEAKIAQRKIEKLSKENDE